MAILGALVFQKHYPLNDKFNVSVRGFFTSLVPVFVSRDQDHTVQKVEKQNVSIFCNWFFNKFFHQVQHNFTAEMSEDAEISVVDLRGLGIKYFFCHSTFY